MTRSQILRTYRIGTAVACLLLCATFVVVWVRSYSWHDWLVGPLPRLYLFDVTSYAGQLEILVSGPAFRRSLWELSSHPIEDNLVSMISSQPIFSRFDCNLVRGRLRVAAPWWFLVLSFGALGAVLGIRTYRFSLFALFFAMTVVAVVLGLAVAFQ
jgi:hypothetical protein